MTNIQGKIAIAVRILIGLIFFGTGVAKLVGVQAMVAEFDHVGFGQWLRYATGLAEVVGALMLIRMRTVPVGAVILLAVLAGALYAQAMLLHGDKVHVIVMAAIVAGLLWYYTPRPSAVATP